MCDLRVKLPWHFHLTSSELVWHQDQQGLHQYKRYLNHTSKNPVSHTCRGRLIIMWGVVCQSWANIYTYWNYLWFHFVGSSLSIDHKFRTWIYNLFNMPRFFQITYFHSEVSHNVCFFYFKKQIHCVYSCTTCTAIYDQHSQYYVPPIWYILFSLRYSSHQLTKVFGFDNLAQPIKAETR